jgi:hypothetical protein
MKKLVNNKKKQYIYKNTLFNNVIEEKDYLMQKEMKNRVKIFEKMRKHLATLTSKIKYKFLFRFVMINRIFFT